MRRPLVLLALTISCAGDSGPAAPSENPATFYRVSGTVRDSVLHVPLSGVRVVIGDSSAFSDSQGRFSTRHRQGRLHVSVEGHGYGALGDTLELFRDFLTLGLTLKGEAPYLLSCTFEADQLTARIVDLQGRKTLNRRSQSTITLLSSGGSVRRDANNWYWTPVDNLTWLAHVPHTGVVVDSAVWRLEDADGYVRSARCVNQTQPCVDCPADALDASPGPGRSGQRVRRG